MMSSKVNKMLKRAAISYPLKEALGPTIENLSSDRVDELNSSIDRGIETARHLVNRPKQIARTEVSNSNKLTQNEIAILSEQVLSVLHKSLFNGPSFDLTGSDIVAATEVLQLASKKVVTQIMTDFFTRNLSTYVETTSKFYRPIIDDDGFAQPADIHRAFAAAESFTLELKPDAIIAVNNGGEIVGRFLHQRLTKIHSQTWNKFKKIRSSDFELISSFSRTEEISKVLIIDDISRSGRTITRVRDFLNKEIRPVTIISYTLVSATETLPTKIEHDYSSCITDRTDIRLPYNTSGRYSHSSGVNVFGSKGADMSITDHEADLNLQNTAVFN